ncbi:hypothetical protein AYI68_g4117 [Smittium mucronatum]|uniref:Uncharacterized protein n=1 Tax=Smittium mucronatum TaxID=133383 RepID=A0A1R0GXZ7_9FUNG|nr:hypothetical protein AYI68_g4117 [Smittium mucronatum]
MSSANETRKSSSPGSIVGQVSVVNSNNHIDLLNDPRLSWYVDPFIKRHYDMMRKQEEDFESSSANSDSDCVSFKRPLEFDVSSDLGCEAKILKNDLCGSSTGLIDLSCEFESNSEFSSTPCNGVLV